MSDYETHPGIGVMLSWLGGNTASVAALKESTDKEIAALGINEERLLFTFADGTAMRLYDEGQSCCERRYMHTDDALEDFIGAQFKKAEVRDGPTENDGEYDDVKESQFLVITTSIGQFTVVNYNEHNGYYGGFALKAEKV